MAAFVWTEDLSTDNPMIDSDHRHLIDLINKLNTAMTSGKGNAVLGSILDELIRYTVSHFGREERLMQQINYAHFTKHKAEHDQLVAEVSALKSNFNSGALTLSSQVYLFLTDWLNRHIKHSDRSLGAASKARKLGFAVSSW